MKKVSIVVPFYNNAKTIDKCLTSIINQTYKNIEIICVSDGGTDGSYDIVKKYTDPRIVLIDGTHGGVSSARNIGIKAATGEYIEFCDSDDYMEPNMVESLVKKIQFHQADIAVCSFTHPSLQNYFGDSVITFKNNYDRLKLYQATFSLQVPWNKLFKKKIITHYFDEELHFSEDELFGLSNLFNAKKVVGTSEKLYHYYVPPKEQSKESTINNIASANKFWETKSTFWYMRMTLLPKVEKILEPIKDDPAYNDFLYTRAFDFMFWEFMIFIESQAPLEGMKAEINNIMHDDIFVKAMADKQRYGINLLKLSDEETSERISYFVNKTVEAQKTFGTNSLMKPYYISVMLWIKLFVDTTNTIKSSEVVSDFYNKLLENKIPEAIYVNNLK